jgi:hypothetical protein
MLHKGFLAMLHETDSHLHTIAIQNRLCKPNARRCEGGDIRGNLRMHAGVRFFAQMTRGREPHRGHTSCIARNRCYCSCFGASSARKCPPPKRAYDNFARDLAGVRFCVQN